MKQFDRISEIMDKDKNTYTMKEIITILWGYWEGCEQGKSETFKSIKSKITQGEWNSMWNGLLATLAISLYASKLPAKEAMEVAQTEGVKWVGLVEMDK